MTEIEALEVLAEYNHAKKLKRLNEEPTDLDEFFWKVKGVDVGY